MSRPKIYLGIDPGIARLGWGVISVEGSTYTEVKSGLIETKKDLRHSERLHIVYEEFSSIVKEHSPDSAGVEKLFFGKNITTAMTVGEARGLILLALEQNKIPHTEYSPAEIKNAVSGYGSADKKQIQEMVKLTLGLKTVPKPDDVADALAVAITAAATTKSVFVS